MPEGRKSAIIFAWWWAIFVRKVSNYPVYDDPLSRLITFSKSFDVEMFLQKYSEGVKFPWTNQWNGLFRTLAMKHIQSKGDSFTTAPRRNKFSWVLNKRIACTYLMPISRLNRAISWSNINAFLSLFDRASCVYQQPLGDIINPLLRR